MGKILIVEPYRTLQQAISAVLVSEHEVESRPVLEASETAGDYDLVVIDAAAVKDRNEAIHALQSCTAPVLWLQGEGFPEPSGPHPSASLKMPLERNSFLSAVNELLSGKAPAKRQPAGDKVAGSEAAAAGKQPSESKDEADSQLIDLVDIVEQRENPPEGKPRV
jgi:hypothetical protein